METYIYSIETGNTTKINLIDSINDSEDNNDYVLYDVTWISDSEIALISTNRVQNESVIIRCNLDGDCAEVSLHILPNIIQNELISGNNYIFCKQYN